MMSESSEDQLTIIVPSKAHLHLLTSRIDIPYFAWVVETDDRPPNRRHQIQLHTTSENWAQQQPFPCWRVTTCPQSQSVLPCIHASDVETLVTLLDRHYHLKVSRAASSHLSSWVPHCLCVWIDADFPHPWLASNLLLLLKLSPLIHLANSREEAHVTVGTRLEILPSSDDQLQKHHHLPPWLPSFLSSDWEAEIVHQWIPWLENLESLALMRSFLEWINGRSDSMPESRQLPFTALMHWGPNEYRPGSSLSLSSGTDIRLTLRKCSDPSVSLLFAYLFFVDENSGAIYSFDCISDTLGSAPMHVFARLSRLPEVRTSLPCHYVFLVSKQSLCRASLAAKWNLRGYRFPHDDSETSQPASDMVFGPCFLSYLAGLPDFQSPALCHQTSSHCDLSDASFVVFSFIVT